MKKAILFLTFNRFDTTQRVFKEIRKAMPPRLYLASDGAREEVAGEKEIVEKIRKFVMDNIDWECEVKTLFRDQNLGCGRAVSEAIGWFFDQEDDGIILEDDCLPHPSFFGYCEQLLDYHKENKKVMHISGDQFVTDFDNGASYYFAKNMHCWGWASWADRWKNYEFDLIDYDEKNVEKFSDNKNVQNYWKAILARIKNHKINTWDYQWTFKIVEMDGLCINPVKNLISNIGFGDNSTHTSDKNNALANMKIYEIGEIIHPKEIEIDRRAVDCISKHHYGINFKNENILGLRPLAKMLINYFRK